MSGEIGPTNPYPSCYQRAVLRPDLEQPHALPTVPSFATGGLNDAAPRSNRELSLAVEDLTHRVALLENELKQMRQPRQYRPPRDPYSITTTIPQTMGKAAEQEWTHPTVEADAVCERCGKRVVNDGEPR